MINKAKGGIKVYTQQADAMDYIPRGLWTPRGDGVTH